MSFIAHNPLYVALRPSSHRVHCEDYERVSIFAQLSRSYVVRRVMCNDDRCHTIVCIIIVDRFFTLLSLSSRLIASVQEAFLSSTPRVDLGSRCQRSTKVHSTFSEVIKRASYHGTYAFTWFTSIAASDRCSTRRDMVTFGDTVTCLADTD